MGETIEYVTGSAAGVGGCLVLQESCVCKKYAGLDGNTLPVAMAVVLRNDKAGKCENAGKIRDAEKLLSDWFQNKFVRQLSRLHSYQGNVEKLLIQAGLYVQDILENLDYSGCICAGSLVSFVSAGDSCGAYYVTEQFGRERLSCVDIDNEDNIVKVVGSTEILFTDVKIEEDVFYRNSIAEALAGQREKSSSNVNRKSNPAVGENCRKDERQMELFLNEIIQTDSLNCHAATGIRFVCEIE